MNPDTQLNTSDQPTNNTSGLTDIDLVKAILKGEASYNDLLKRSKNPKIAAQFYAATVADIYSPSNISDRCDACGLEGKPMEINWAASFIHEKDIVPSAISAIAVAVVTVVGGLAVSFEPGSTEMSFTTHHCRCRSCRPSLFRKLLAGVVRCIICLILLAALFGLIMSGGIIIYRLGYDAEIQPETFWGSVVIFIITASMFLSLLFGWNTKLYKAITIPADLRIIAQGPFDLENNSKSFRKS